jgi:hypothetical protein
MANNTGIISEVQQDAAVQHYVLSNFCRNMGLGLQVLEKKKSHLSVMNIFINKGLNSVCQCRIKMNKELGN